MTWVSVAAPVPMRVTASDLGSVGTCTVDLDLGQPIQVALGFDTNPTREGIQGEQVIDENCVGRMAEGSFDGWLSQSWSYARDLVDSGTV